MPEAISVASIIPASAQHIYEAWLSGDAHGAMIGDSAEYNFDDDTFTAWSGYIEGKTIEKVPFRRIVQLWRSSEFLPDDPDSQLVVLLTAVDGGTRVTLEHSNIPDGQSEAYVDGWAENYFVPMFAYFSELAAPAAPVKKAASKPAKKPAKKIVKKPAKKVVKKAAKKVAKKAPAKKKVPARKAKKSKR